MSSTAPAEPAAREARIDVIRGIAILVILINHLSQVAELGGVTIGLIPTPTRFGWSTAAELFVMLSGYMVGLVYLRRERPARIVWRRAGKLWIYNLALLAIVAPLVFVMTAEELRFWRLDALAESPFGAAFDLATLQAAPRLMDVLLLYIVLMLAAPIAIAVERRSWIALVAGSIAIYAAAQVVTIYRLETVTGATKDGLLDRLSWQMLFFVPMALGARNFHQRVFAWLEGQRGVFAILLLAVVAAAFVYRGQTAGVLATPRWLEARFGLTVLRVGHALLILAFYASAFTLARGWLDRQPLRSVAVVGRHSLDCFAIGVLLTYGLGTAWLHWSGTLGGYYLMVLLAAALTVALGYRRERGRTTRASNPAPAR
jgi:hypothetical protein